MRMRTLFLVLAATAVALGTATGALAGRGFAETGLRSTTIDSIIEHAPEVQLEALQDGYVSIAEYSDAVDGAITCMTDLGFEARRNTLLDDHNRTRHVIVVESEGAETAAMAEESLSAMDEAYDACTREFSLAIERVYAWQGDQLASG